MVARPPIEVMVKQKRTIETREFSRARMRFIDKSCRRKLASRSECDARGPWTPASLRWVAGLQAADRREEFGAGVTEWFKTTGVYRFGQRPLSLMRQSRTAYGQFRHAAHHSQEVM